MSYHPQNNDCPCCGNYGTERLFVCKEGMQKFLETYGYFLCKGCNFVNVTVQNRKCEVEGCSWHRLLCENCLSKYICQDCCSIICPMHFQLVRERPKCTTCINL